jgi:hypothetical protein
MDSRIVVDLSLTSDAAEFVRFCYRRRKVAWPCLYDEMCSVASRGLFRGWGFSELAEHGIGFSLEHTPRLADLVMRVLEADGERRPRLPGPLMIRRPMPAPMADVATGSDPGSAPRRRSAVPV